MADDAAGATTPVTTSRATPAVTPGVASIQAVVIVNPVSGTNRAALETIQAYLEQRAGWLESVVQVTQADGDAQCFAREAAARGVDLVAAYGGDGTQMEAAIGLMGSTVPLAILPGGTANVMAVEMGVPLTLEQALDTAFDPGRQVRLVDMGEIDSQPFLLRASIGYEAEISGAADRGEKLKKGRAAYFENALRRLRHLTPTRFIITVDGTMHVRTGISCLVCNSTHLGVGSLRFVENGDVSDGLLDVFVIRSLKPWALARLAMQVARSLRPSRDGSTGEDQWQGRQITVQMSRRQFVARDGEPMKRTRRVSAHVLPGAARIIVPAVNT